jgi:hypothetical protein
MEDFMLMLLIKAEDQEVQEEVDLQTAVLCQVLQAILRQ